MNATLRIENARLWTADPARPRARSVTIRAGRIVTLDEPVAAEPVIDVRGDVVTPGLIDAHLHLLLGGESLEQLDLSRVRSRDEFEAAIAARHAALPPDRWLLARGWSNENWPSRKLPDRSWLAAAGDRPVVCTRMDLHAALVNDAVLARLDLARDPPGGRIVRDAAGRPTGVLVEAAAWELVNPIVPKATIAERRAAALVAQHHAHACGLTTVGSMEYLRDLEEVFVPLRDRLTLRCRLTLLDRAWPMDFSPGRDFTGDEGLAVIGYKAFIDGTIGSRTARLLAPYADDPGNRGLLVELAKDGHLLDWARAVADAGLSPSMHAIGDEAARLALEAVEAVGPEARPRIEHAQQIALDDLPRFTGVIASMQPLHKADDGRSLERRVGRERLAGSFAFRRLLDAGARLAFGSDWPVVSLDPVQGIRAAVTGLTLDEEPFLVGQNVSVEEALVSYTREAAYALGLDDAGVLRPGAAADLVVWESDPFAADWAASPPRIRLTIAGGRVVYDAGTASESDSAPHGAGPDLAAAREAAHGR